MYTGVQAILHFVFLDTGVRRYDETLNSSLRRNDVFQRPLRESIGCAGCWRGYVFLASVSFILD